MGPKQDKGDFDCNPPRVQSLHTGMQEFACSGERQGNSSAPYISEENWCKPWGKGTIPASEEESSDKHSDIYKTQLHGDR